MKIAGIVAAVFLLAGCSSLPRMPAPPAAPLSSFAPSMHTVIYEVDGTATGADLTMEINGQSSQQSAALPLMNKAGTVGIIQHLPSGAFIYISAQSKNEAGTISCHVLVDGVQTITNTSSGAYVIASCSGRV